jgi:O-antigen/teichoic acid export membrane protein
VTLRSVTASFVARAVARARAPLYRNALVLLGNSGVTAGLGFVFWTLAARLYPPAEVGLASAAISSSLFIATLSQLGLPYALVSFSPSAGAGRAAFTWTVVLIVAIGSAIAGGIFIAGLDLWAPSLEQLASPPLLGVVLIVLAVATGTFTVLVYAAIGTRDARPALAGGVTHGLVKSALILVFAIAFAPVGILIVLAWLLGTIAGVLLQLWLLRTKVTRKVDLQVLRLGSLVRYAAGNHVGDLACAGSRRPSCSHSSALLTQSTASRPSGCSAWRPCH